MLDETTRRSVGVFTLRYLLDTANDGATHVRHLIKQSPRVVYDDLTLRNAADHMVNHDIGRLPVVRRDRPGEVIGMITRSDLLGAHRRRLTESREAVAGFRMRNGKAKPASAAR